MTVAQKDGSREVMLRLRVSVPHFSKPEQDMKSAQFILHQIRTSVHAEATAQVWVEGANREHGTWETVSFDGQAWWQ